MPVNKIRRLGSFAPLSAQAYKDDALANSGEAAELLYYRALSFAADTLQDGFITDMQLSRFVGAGMKDPKKRADKLCSVGLWTREDGGYRIVSWLKWNRSREEITDLQRKDAGRKPPKGTPPDGGGTQSDSESDQVPSGFQTESEREGTQEQLGIQPSRVGPRARSPYPYPEPYPETKEKTLTPDESDAEFDRFWSAYPRKVGKADARKKWAKACKKLTPDELVSEAERWSVLWSQAGTAQQFIPHPATWLNGERWADEAPTHLRAVSGGYEPFRNPANPADYWEDL